MPASQRISETPGIHGRSFGLGAASAAIVALGIALAWPAARPTIGENGGEHAVAPAPRAPAAADPRAPAPDATARELVAPGKLPLDELRRALRTSSRLEQVRAITALVDDGSPEARQVL